MKLSNKTRSAFFSRIASTEFYLFCVLLGLILVVSLISPRFLSAENFFSMALSYSYTGIFAIGFLFVLISGGMDISFAAVATVAQYLMASAMVAQPDIPIVVVVLIPILTGCALGALNALLIHYLNAPSIIVSLANLNIYYGILQFISGGTWLYDFPDWFSQFSLTLAVSLTNEQGVHYGLSVVTLIWIALALVASFVLRKLKAGRKLYAMGGNLEASRRAGISILRYRLFAYITCGFTAGLGGMVHTFVTQTVAPNTLVGREFDVVAAVVLGGASIFGGSGSVGGTLLGVALIAVITNALTIMKVPDYWHMVFIGAVVLLSIGITAMSEKRSRKGDRNIYVA